MEHCRKRNAGLMAVLLVLLATLSASAFAQDAPNPLTDDEFALVIESSDTTMWLKIQVMTDDQAKLLSKKRGIELTLGFASDPVYCFYLNNLRSLNAVQAKALAKTKSSLCLNGLKELPVESAKELVRYSGEYVPRLKGSQLMASIGGIVALNGLESLSDDLAKSLGKVRAYELQLNGVKTLTKTQAKNLAMSESGIMQLASVTSFAEDVAKDLSMYDGKYFMPRLAPESLNALVKNGGETAGR